jgi:hypothetical protein
MWGSTERNLETCLDRVDGVGEHHDRSLREGCLDHRRYSLLGCFAMPCCFLESRPGFCQRCCNRVVDTTAMTAVKENGSK